MIELFINTVKLLVAKETRDAGSSLIEVIRKAPEWQRDICTLTLRVDISNRELTHLIRMLCVEKLINLSYDLRVIDSFQTSYTELVTNAFEYGCSKNKEDSVEIETDITKAYVTLRVKNARGITFYLSSVLQNAAIRLRNNPKSPRGRGLLLVNQLADEFSGQEDNRTVKAVFYKDYVELESFEFQTFTFLRLRSGLFNPSCAQQIEKLALTKLHSNLILDLSLWHHIGTTLLITTILNLERIYEDRKRKLIVVASPSTSNIFGHSPFSTPFSIVRSWEQALEVINSSSLLSEMEEVIPEAAKIQADFSAGIQLPPEK